VGLRAIGYKLIYIFFPLLMLAAAFVGLYSFANWLLVASTGWVPLDRDVVNYWLPAVLGTILVGTLVAPRLRILRLSERRNIPFLYQAFAVVVLIAPA